MRSRLAMNDHCRRQKEWLEVQVYNGFFVNLGMGTFEGWRRSEEVTGRELCGVVGN
ncbi:hypothetical protein HanIR_Chr04g0150651 [Helianthus annuus]|nr:hypothetical protein HanIR_Chr04g0150651 [Helianthus annuus]